MANEVERKEARDRINQNIARDGYHTYVVSGGSDPHYAYTIGLSGPLGAELIIAGAYFYMLEDLPVIIKSVVANLTPNPWDGREFDIEGRGSFSLRKVHTSWTTSLMLGAVDFYQSSGVRALQIVPDAAHWTIDVPNMSEAWNLGRAAGWRWMYEPWTYPVPVNSMAITNLGALRRERITEVMRWEEDEWEIFAGAGPDIPKAEMRVVPLGVLLAADESLIPIVDLAIGGGLWRDTVSKWHPWDKRGKARK